MCRDRSVIEENPEFKYLRDAVYATPVVGLKTVFVRARPVKRIPMSKKSREQVRTSRDAELEIRKATVTLNVPSYFRHKYNSLEMNVVAVLETSPPKGEEPVEWILLTTLPIETFQQVLAVIEYYECRWMIEIFFKTLKSGCKVESLQFEEIDRLLSCLGVYMIVAWRVLIRVFEIRSIGPCRTGDELRSGFRRGRVEIDLSHPLSE